MNLYTLLQYMVKHKVLLLSAAVSLAVIAMLSQYSFLDIEVAGEKSGTYTYSIVSQDDQEKTEIKTASSKLKRLVPRGNYEVLISNDDASSMQIVRTGGFLSSTEMNPDLKSEKSRHFIGDNPKPCMFIDEHLFSFECGELFDTLVKHVPATLSVPGYTLEVPVPLEGINEGFVRLAGERYLLVQALAEDSETGTHSLYRFSGSELAGQPIVLTDLDGDKSYAATAYKDGFLVYREDFSDVKYYPKASAKPTDIAIPTPSDENLSAHFLTAGSNGILAAYTDAHTEPHDTDEGLRKVNTEIIAVKGDSSKRIELNGFPVSDALYCGSSKLCILESDDLVVYDISGANPKSLYKLTGVNKIISSKEGILVVRNEEILSIDVENRSGYVDYSLGPYQYCGLQAEEGSYVLCLIGAANRKIALFIDRSTANSDSIDKKVAQLAKLPEVDSVSAYKNILYISPNLGPLGYREDIRGYGYSPDVQKQIGNIIDRAINRIGIDREKYQIINPFQ